MSEKRPSKTAVQLFGEGREPRDTREKILFAALDLFYAYGFHAVGLDRILAEVGVTKTTFYNHFPSKDDLVKEIIVLRDEWEGATFLKAVVARGEYDPKSMLLAMFDVMHEWFTSEDYNGCMFLNAAAEYPSLVHPVHKAAALHYVKTEDAIAAMAKAAGVTEPQGLARQWAILLEGAMTYRMLVGDDAAAGAAREMAADLLERSIGDAAPA